MSGLTISQLAKNAGVNVATIRYYERRGLLKKTQRSASGYRLYSADFVAHIQFIMRAKTLGFTLKEITELLALDNESTRICNELQQKISKKLDLINNKINLLQKMQTSLQQLQAHCKQPEQCNKCSIATCLSEQSC